MTIQEEIEWGVERVIRKGIEASTLGEHRSLARTVEEVLKYLDSKNVKVQLPNGDNLEGCCIARLERLINE